MQASNEEVSVMSASREATAFVLMAIQEWGQTGRQRIEAVQKVLDAAGIKATATCWPAVGGIWPKPCTGPDGEAATAWLKELTTAMKRGKFEEEEEHVQKFIDNKRKRV